MTASSDEAPSWRGTLREMVIIGTACLVFCGAGALLAWPAAALPALTSASQPALSSSQASWTVAALHAGQVLGAAPGALLASRIGRRAALLLCAPPMVGAWLLLALAGDGGDGGGGVLAMLVTGRTLGGVAVGAAFAAGPLYAAEAASARLRGGAGALVQLALSAGQLLVYCCGAWLSLRVLALTAAVLPVLFMVAFWRAPESPHWLLRRGRHDRAERALRTLRGSTVTNEQIKAEINALEGFACAETSNKENSPNGGINVVLKELIVDKASRRALIIVMTLVTLQTFSGFTALLAYCTIIFELSGSSLDSSQAVIVLGVILVVMSLVSPAVIDRAGRRFCLLLSCSVGAVALICEGAFFYARQRFGDDFSTADWLPVVALVAYFIAFTLGLGPLPTAVAGELFPAPVRALAGAIVSVAIGLGGILSAKLYQIISDLWGVHVSMWIFGAVCLLGIWFSLTAMPETKGRSFDEIQQILVGYDKKMKEKKERSSTETSTKSISSELTSRAHSGEYEANLTPKNSRTSSSIGSSSSRVLHHSSYDTGLTELQEQNSSRITGPFAEVIKKVNTNNVLENDVGSGDYNYRIDQDSIANDRKITN